MKQISIKTTDGNRFDFLREIDNWPFKVGDLNKDWVKIEEDSVIRMFLRQNIVSITVRDVDNA